MSLYHSSNGGESWDIIHFPVPLDGTWIPLQLQFTSPTFRLGGTAKTNQPGIRHWDPDEDQ